MIRKKTYKNDLEEIQALLWSLKHRPEDQKPHGNRYSVHTESGTRVLVHREWSKPGSKDA